MIAQSKEKNDAKKALELKARTKEVQIMMMDMGTLKGLVVYRWIRLHVNLTYQYNRTLHATSGDHH
jgi:hypothetical protein